MATINEILRLEDRFTSTMTSYLRLMQQGQRQTQAIQEATRTLTQVLQQQGQAQLRAQIQADIARAELRRQQEQMNRTATSANSLTSALRRLGGAYFGIQGLIGITRLSDELVSTESRINLINDGLQTTAELQNMIYQAADRSRGSYMAMQSTVAKLGLLAGDAFESSQEMVAFTELLNKNFIVGGASAQEQTAAMYQLTQAMASGRLQGDEYRSIIENAPLLAQAIEDYMRNVQGATGSMKDWASQGLLTSNVIKAAMFNAADEVEERFASMPITWAQAWQMAKNMSIAAFQPLLNVVGMAANFVGEHIEVFVGGFYGLAAAVGVYSIAQLAANASFKKFVMSMLASPLLPLAAAFMFIGAAVGVFIKHCGGGKAAWLTFVDAALTAGQNLWIGTVNVFYGIRNKADELGYKFASVTIGIANAFGDMKANVMLHLQNMVNGGIGYINRFIGALNRIPGVNIEEIQTANFGDMASANNIAEKAARASALEDRAAQVAANMASRAANISAMQTAANMAHATRQQAIEAARTGAEEASDYSKYGAAMASDIASITGDTKAIKNSVDMSDETLKMLVDMAERRYVNNINLTAQSPVIQIQGQNTGDTIADKYKLADMLKDVLMEQASAGATRSTAMAF